MDEESDSVVQPDNEPQSAGLDSEFRLFLGLLPKRFLSFCPTGRGVGYGMERVVRLKRPFGGLPVSNSPSTHGCLQRF